MFTLLRLVVFLLIISQQSFGSESCKYTNSLKHCVSISFVEEISRRKDSKFTLKVLKSNGENIVDNIKDLKIDLWMQMDNGHDHGSDKVFIKKNKKIFNISNVWLLMMGEWQFKYSYTFNKDKASGQIPVCVGRTPKDSHLGKCSKK